MSRADLARGRIGGIGIARIALPPSAIFQARRLPGSSPMLSRMEAGMEACPRSVTFVASVFMASVIHHAEIMSTHTTSLVTWESKRAPSYCQSKPGPRPRLLWHVAVFRQPHLFQRVSHAQTAPFPKYCERPEGTDHTKSLRTSGRDRPHEIHSGRKPRFCVCSLIYETSFSCMLIFYRNLVFV